MSKTADALRLSSARTPIAIGQMSVEDILGSLSEEQRTGIAASLAAEPAPGTPPAPAASADDAGDERDPNDPEEVEETDRAKKKGGADSGGDAQSSDDFAKGFAAATDRALAVMASEHFEGRAAQAQKLLGNAKLSADEIVEMLADMPDGSGQQMLDRIRGNNPNLGTGGGSADASGTRASGDHGWGKAHARAAKLFGGAAKKTS